jgi:hypothetical protein
LDPVRISRAASLALEAGRKIMTAVVPDIFCVLVGVVKTGSIP